MIIVFLNDVGNMTDKVFLDFEYRFENLVEPIFNPIYLLTGYKIRVSCDKTSISLDKKC